MRIIEGSDPEHVGLLREVLQVIFGLEPEISNRVIRTIRNSPDVSDVKTNIVRVRIGARAMKYLRNSIEIARHEGSEKHEAKKDRDVEKETDLEPQQLEQERKRKEKEEQTTTESLTFKEFFLSEREVTISIDPENDAETRKKIATVRQNPDRARVQSMTAAKDERATAQREGDAISAKIAALRMQIKQLEAQQARMSARTQQ